MMALLRRREMSLLAITVFVAAIVTLRSPAFLAWGNFQDILKQSSILLIISIGQLLVILTGGIDLSVASTIGLTGMAVALLNWWHPGIPLVLIVLLSMTLGLVLGSFNGLLVSVFSIPAIVTTLGTMSIYRGLVIVLSGGTEVSADKLGSVFTQFPQGHLLGFSNMIAIALLVSLLFAAFLYLTRTGRELYGVGGNSTAAAFVGINVKKINFSVFALSGVLSGLAGYLWVAFYASAANDSATGLELQTVAACVISGVSIMGGSGTIVGVILGSVFLGIVNNALTVVHISPFWQEAIEGFMILLAIVVNTALDQRVESNMLRRRVL